MVSIIKVKSTNDKALHSCSSYTRRLRKKGKPQANLHKANFQHNIDRNCQEKHITLCFVFRISLSSPATFTYIYIYISYNCRNNKSLNTHQYLNLDLEQHIYIYVYKLRITLSKVLASITFIFDTSTI